jgi:hypothetical protein
MIPDEIRRKLISFKDQKSSDGGGKRYWADGVRPVGIIETPRDGLFVWSKCWYVSCVARGEKGSFSMMFCNMFNTDILRV